jgi:hypothetical protein
MTLTFSQLFWFAWTNYPNLLLYDSIVAGAPFSFGMVLVYTRRKCRYGAEAERVRMMAQEKEQQRGRAHNGRHLLGTKEIDSGHGADLNVE